jgi:Flp pilus assembly protein TadG
LRRSVPAARPILTIALATASELERNRLRLVTTFFGRILQPFQTGRLHPRQRKASGVVMQNILRSVRRSLRAFRLNRRGNVTMTFALSLIPMIAAIGSAVDYSRANSARSAMQAALDASALILSKDAQTLTTDQLNAKALSVFLANFHRSEATDISVTPAFTNPTPGSFVLQINASGKVPTTFMGMWQPTMSISANAQAVWGMKRLELALALDNTGSMQSSQKMTQLKLAAKDLLKTLQNAAKKADDVRVSIIPFTTDVNVGTANVNANWIRWDEWDADSANQGCSKTQYTSKFNCQNNGGTWGPKPHSNWNGCVWDRDQNNDVTNVATSSGTKSTLYSAHQESACPVPMLPLTNDWSALNAKIDAMTPNGNTNVTIGLQMAFQSISPVAPFNASATQADLDKVIILLTDGDNTENRWSTNQSTIDARTKLACANVKAANIKLYTIRVIDGNASLLQQCATKPDMYYDVQQASQLSAVFSTIAQNLANLRLSK